jgi:hypothetical protein
MKRRDFAKNFALTVGALGLSPVQQVLAQVSGGLRPNDRTVAVGETATGIVYGERDGRKVGLSGVAVSNGREVVQTDARGRYRLPVSDSDIIFVVKPRGYRLPLNTQNLPQFYRIHQPQGSPKQEYPGIAPTGPLPTSLDFTVQAQDETDDFRVLLFGDPQSRNQQEIDYLVQDIVTDLIGTKAAFGVSLGDLAFDKLEIHENQNRAISLIGLPWFNVMGNHDINFDAPTRKESAETYKSIFGPTYYSFDYGQVHFVVLDDVAYDGQPTAGGKGAYHTELGEKQLAWLANDLKLVPQEKLVVLMMHIPLVNPEIAPASDLRDLAQFYRIIENRRHCMSISAHTHFQEHMFLGRENGWNGAQPHHHLNHATVCGSWWRGAPDEMGIPHTTMRDGSPNGYSFLNFKGNQYAVEFKAARREASHQMNIYAPSEIAATTLAQTQVLANVFAGSKKSKVEMQVGERAWLPMQRVAVPDPAYAACKELEKVNPKVPGRKLPEIINSPHVWGATLPADLARGTHLIRVRTTDMFGQNYADRRILRVV